MESKIVAGKKVGNTSPNNIPAEKAAPLAGSKLKGSNQRKVDKVKVTLNFHGSCVEKDGSTRVVFGGLIRTNDVFFVYGEDHEDTKCIIAPKEEAGRLGKTFSKEYAEKHGLWKPISEFTAKFMGLKEGLKIALGIDGEKNISVCEVEKQRSVLSQVKQEECVEYVLNIEGTYEGKKNKGILAECIKYCKECESETTNIELKVRVNNLDI